MPNSSLTSRQKVAITFKHVRLPLWAPVLLLIAAGVLGLLLSWGSGSVGAVYIALFAIGAIAGTLFVRPQGLVLAVSEIPLLFAIITPVVSWFLTSIADPSEGGATDSTPTKTRLITAAYPVVQYFPWLVGILGVCVILALWRYFELTRINSKQQISERKEAKRRKEQSKKSNESAARARRHMAESDERLSGQRRAGGRRHGARHGSEQLRPASDIIRDAEQRRLERAERAERARQERIRPERPRTEPAQPSRSRAEFSQPEPSRPEPSRPDHSWPKQAQPMQRVWGDKEAAVTPKRREARDATARPWPDSASDSPRRPLGHDRTRSRESYREFPIERGERAPQGDYDRRRSYPQEWPPRRERPRHPQRRNPRS